MALFSRKKSLLGLCFLIVLSSFAPDKVPMSARATDAYPTTNDQAFTIQIPRWFYWGQTGDQVTQLINENGARITKLRIDDPSVPTFSVSMVQNSGDYGSAWWWYPSVDAQTLGTLLNGRRLISIDPYFTSAGLRFAAVMVPDTGVQDRAWWWYFGEDVATIGQLLTKNNARPVELRPYNDNGQQKFVVIMISNTGQDYKGWEWWSGVTPDFINTRIQTGLRVISLAPDPSGNWATILIDCEGESWWWYYGISPNQVLSNIGAHNSRLIDISNYKDSKGNLLFTSVELDDSNIPQKPINTQSQSVYNHAEQNGWSGGYHGSYFAESSSSLNPIVADNSGFRYEPASSIKVLYLLYTLRQGVDLNSQITYYWPNSSHPNPNVCPANVVAETPANAQKTTILNALQWMIQESNNVFTRAFAIHWGLGPVQAMAQSLGMSNTHLSQPYIGCGFRGCLRNELTLEDAAKLYSSVDRGVALSGTARSTFFNILVGGSPSASDPFGRVVTQEAAKLGKSVSVTQFLSKMNIRWKAGGYSFCLTGDSSCNPHKIDFSITGWMSIPFKPSTRSFLFGDFVNDLAIPCSPGSSCAALQSATNEVEANAAEAARGTINQALATW